MALPELDCSIETNFSLGNSEAKLRDQFGDKYPAFDEYMPMSVHPRCTGKGPCSEPYGDVYYRHDVLRFVERA